MKTFLHISFLTLTFMAFSVGAAFAMDLTAAKSSGLVGEKPNGLIEATLPNPSPELSELIQTTNAGRLEVYKESAGKQGIPLKEVQAIAAQKLYDMANPGDFLFINGKWTKR